MQPPPVLHHHKRGCRLEGGQPLNLVQLVHLARQLHHGQRRIQKLHFHTHQRLIRRHPAGMRRENRLEMVVCAVLTQHLQKLPAQLCCVDLLIIGTDIKFTHCALGLMLHLIHGKIRILFKRSQIPAVLRIPRDTAGNADAHGVAVRQKRRALLYCFGKPVQHLTDFVPSVVAIEQHNEFISRHTGANGILGQRLCKALTRQIDISVAPVMAERVVDLLEVIHIHHQQCSMPQLFRHTEQFFRPCIKGTAVVQTGQHIVIALMLDAAALKCRCSHILDQTDLHLVLAGDAQHDKPLTAVLLRNGEHTAAILQTEALLLQHQLLHQHLKLLPRHIIRVGVLYAKHGEKVVGHEYFIAVLTDFIAAEFNACHVHNTQEFRGGIQNILTEPGDCGGKAVYLADAGARELWDFRSLILYSGYLVGQLPDRMRQSAADQIAAYQTNTQRQHDCHQQQTLHIVGDFIQRAVGHHAEQQPVLIRKWCVAVVQRQRFRTDEVFCLIDDNGAGSTAVLHDNALRAFQRTILRGKRHRLQRNAADRLFISHYGEQICAGTVILQLGQRQLLLQIAAQQLHADNAVHRAVRQDERLRVCDCFPLVSRQNIRRGRPAAVLRHQQLAAVLIGGHERLIHKIIKLFIVQRGLPAGVRRNTHGLHDSCRCKRQHQILVALGSRRIRVQIAQINARQTPIGLAGIQIACIEHHEYARHRRAAQLRHQIIRNRFKQRLARSAALSQRIL